MRFVLLVVLTLSRILVNTWEFYFSLEDSRKSTTPLSPRTFVRTCVASWRMKNLSLASRVTLMNSVLTSIPSKTTQSVLLPKGFCEKVDSIFRSVLWGHTLNNQKVNLVDWETVCEAQDNSVLCIKSAAFLNKGYMMKLAWRFLSRPKDLWVRVLSNKYLAGHDSNFTKSRKSTLSPIWGMLSVTDETKNAITWSIGNGKRINF